MQPSMTLIYLLILFLLLFLNAFFVLAEFAAVRVRGSQIEALGTRNPTVRMVAHMHKHIDEYLSCCQLGITLTSIGLGFVGEPAVAQLLEPYIKGHAAAHAVAITISYLFVSVLHIVLGEQVPKIAAISFPVGAAMLVAWPMRFTHWLFYVPLKVLNGMVKLILWPFGVRKVPEEAAASEAEVRIILERSQQEGVMSFQRLLLLENVFDFGDVRVRDEMRKIENVVALHADHPWEENRDKIMASFHTRYPLLEGNPPRPLGVVHIKALVQGHTAWPAPVDLKALAYKPFITTPDTPLEKLLTELRRRRTHMALVQDIQGKLVGLVTMEDILEQLVGAIEDEFEKEVPLRLGDILKEARILVDLKAESAEEAICEIVTRCDTSEAPEIKPAIIDAVLLRERSFPTYLGHGLAVPHARLESIKTPILFFARSPKGVVFDAKKPEERARILFLLLAPGSVPRMQTKVLARIANLRESAYVWDRLMEASSAGEALEAIRGGDELITT
jgi:CBS domain containing-hemolysin-like protein